jgi:hypothetical protein
MANPGNTINVQDEIDDAVMNGGDFTDIFSDASNKGADYVVYTHPSFEGDKEQRVIVALNPGDTLGTNRYPFITENNKPIKTEKSLSVPAVREMVNWQELAFRKLKQGKPLKFEWEARDIPADVAVGIKAKLDAAEERRLSENAATSEDDIKAAFEIGTVIPAETVTIDNEIKLLAEALNKAAEAVMINKESENGKETERAN